jgi:hypothetical protein
LYAEGILQAEADTLLMVALVKGNHMLFAVKLWLSQVDAQHYQYV